MERFVSLMTIASTIEEMTNRFVEEPIAITFERVSPRALEEDKTLRQRFNVVDGDEYFFISKGPSLLYVVDVTADSYLTAAHELMELIARKF